MESGRPWTGGRGREEGPGAAAPEAGSSLGGGPEILVQVSSVGVFLLKCMGDGEVGRWPRVARSQWPAVPASNLGREWGAPGGCPGAEEGLGYLAVHQAVLSCPRPWAGSAAPGCAGPAPWPRVHTHTSLKLSEQSHCMCR